MTLLSICAAAATEAGFTAPATIVGSSDPDAIRLLALAKRELRELARYCPWQALTAEHTFTSVATAIQTSSIPSDFDWIVPETCWDRTQYTELLGPKTGQEWQRIQVNTTALGYGRFFRIRGDSFLIHPAPTAGHTIAYEYVINTPCESSGAVAQSTWLADTDVGRIDEDLLAMGVRWRFKRLVGVSYDTDLNEYLSAIADAARRDNDPPTRGVARVGEVGLTGGRYDYRIGR